MSPAFGSLFGAKPPNLGKVTLGVYGKLGLSKEFLRIRCSDGAGHAFYEWVNEGFDHAGLTLGRAPEGIGRQEWIFHPDGFKEAVVATMRDSADHGGERRFPFLCFALVRRDRLEGSLGEQLGLTAALFKQLWAVDARFDGCADRREFQDAAAAVKLDPAVDAALEPGMDGPLWPRFGAPEEVIASLYQAARALAILSSGRVPGPRLPALRLPLAGDDAAARRAFAAAWTHMLGSTSLMGERRTPASFVRPAPGSDGRTAWLVARVPRPSDFTMLCDPSEGLFYPDPGGDLARVEPEPWTDFARRAAEAFGAPDATLEQLAGFRLLAP